MKETNRRYDIDWLRVIAIGFLLIYHIGIGFQPWGVFIQFIQSDQPLEALWIPMTMMNVWRIPLLFFVSGMGVCFAIRKRNWKQLIRERTRRILVPFLFGMFFIVPIHIFIWQAYYHQEISYTLHPVHLWFLANIFIYVILLSPVFFYLKKHRDGLIIKWLIKVYSHPAGLLIIAVPFILEVVLVAPESYETYALNLHGFLLGLMAFFFGFTFVLTGKVFWQTVCQRRWMYLSVAFLFYLVRYFVFDLKAPGYLLPIESLAWIFGIFGLGYQYLNKPGKVLSYLSQAAYPVYILHMVFLYLSSYMIFSFDISPWLQFIFVVILTFAGCFAAYELLIRRTFLLRLLFGLKIATPLKEQDQLKKAIQKPDHFKLKRIHR